VQTDLFLEDDGNDFDDDRDRPSLALDVYRSATRGLDSLDTTTRPYDTRDDTPGFEVPITTDDGDFDSTDFDYE
jgi:hypothetical protein